MRSVDCVGQWQGWGQCDCNPEGGGTKSRTYTITTPAQNGGQECADKNKTQTTSCNFNSCPAPTPDWCKDLCYMGKGLDKCAIAKNREDCIGSYFVEGNAANEPGKQCYWNGSTCLPPGGAHKTTTHCPKIVVRSPWEEVLMVELLMVCVEHLQKMDMLVYLI